MKQFLALAVLVLLASPVYADDGAPPTKSDKTGPTVVIGNFSEAATGRFDYNLIYVIVSAGDLRVQLDRFDNPMGLNRIWLNYGSLNLLQEGEVSLAVSPSVLVSNQGHLYYGAFVDLDVAKRFHVHYKALAGNRVDKHIVFTSLQLTEEIGLQHYYYAEQGWTPDSYIGPTFKLGDLSVWGGPSLNRPGAWTLDASLQVHF